VVEPVDSDQPPDRDGDHLPDGSPDADEDDETEAGADGDMPDVEVPECPLNSRAFCLCDSPWYGLCDDGSFCLTVENLGLPGDYGYCAPECDCSDYDVACPESLYRAEPKCILINSWPVTEYSMCNCVLIHCNINADCPPGQTCQHVRGTHGEYNGVLVSICSP
jgi:hypothetical protein